jgi:hypothetical protein
MTAPNNALSNRGGIADVPETASSAAMMSKNPGSLGS